LLDEGGIHVILPISIKLRIPKIIIILINGFRVLRFGIEREKALIFS